MPPKAISAPSARQAVITKPKDSGQKPGLIAQHSSIATASAAPKAATRKPARPWPGACDGQRGARDVVERIRILATGRRHAHVLLAAQPEDDRGQQHQDAGDAEGHRRPVAAQEQRHQQRGEEGTEIDRPVEEVEDDLGQVLVVARELVADEAEPPAA